VEKPTSSDGVFLVHHVREFRDGTSDVKFIGVFSSEKDALDATSIVRSKSGFKDFPDDFSVEFYKIGKLHWTEGFIEGDE
jgi:homoserine kinase type II